MCLVLSALKNSAPTGQIFLVFDNYYLKKKSFGKMQD